MFGDVRCTRHKESRDKEYEEKSIAGLIRMVSFNRERRHQLSHMSSVLDTSDMLNASPTYS